MKNNDHYHFQLERLLLSDHREAVQKVIDGLCMTLDARGPATENPDSEKRVGELTSALETLCRSLDRQNDKWSDPKECLAAAQRVESKFSSSVANVYHRASILLGQAEPFNSLKKS